MTSPPTDDAVRILAAAMAAANLVAITLILRWERSGREARVLAPARWRLPRFGTALTALPFLYPVVALGAPGWLAWRVSALLHALGAATWALGVLEVLWCVRVMRGQTGAKGIVVGHRLVTSGPYRLVRHPMYAAVLLVSAGSALALGSLVIAVAAALFAPLAVSWAATEDRLMSSSGLGQSFRDYERRTGRLVPRLRRRRSAPGG